MTNKLTGKKFFLLKNRKREEGILMNEEKFASYFDQEGRLTQVEAFKKDVFYGGIEPSLRREAWKFLLG
jgi:hypothetical protein